jgi:alpha-tubulin suppressor-like RCC1 family protein
MAILSTFGAMTARGLGWLANLATGAGLYAWGQGNSGQLGQGSLLGYSSPVQVGTLTTWSKASAGQNFAATVKTDGTLYMWGENASGQLGLGDTTQRSNPVQVGALTTWSVAYPRANATHASKTDGTLWAWGAGAYGALGVGNTTNYSSPVQVGALTTWASATKGAYSAYKTVAIKTNGTLWAWGDNSAGQLGQGNTTVRSSPVQVGTATNWLSTGLSAGGYYTMVIRS